jgi:hypothetical protein
MVLAMLVTNGVVGLTIAHLGRYKAFVLVGFAAGTSGFGLMASAGPGTAYPFLILPWSFSRPAQVSWWQH